MREERVWNIYQINGWSRTAPRSYRRIPNLVCRSLRLFHLLEEVPGVRGCSGHGPNFFIKYFTKAHKPAYIYQDLISASLPPLPPPPRAPFVRILDPPQDLLWMLWENLLENWIKGLDIYNLGLNPREQKSHMLASAHYKYAPIAWFPKTSMRTIKRAINYSSEIHLILFLV